MSKLTVTPYRAIHAMHLFQNGVRLPDKPVVTSEYAQTIAEAYERIGPAFSIFCETELIGCGGMIIQGAEGVAWTLFSPRIEDFKKTIVRVTKLTIEAIAKEYNLTTIKAGISIDDVQSLKWIRMLGFTEIPAPPKAGLDGRLYLTYGRAV